MKFHVRSTAATLAVIGLAFATAAPAMAGSADPTTGTAGVPASPSVVSATASNSAVAGPEARGKCRTAFGAPTAPDPNSFYSWEGGGLDFAGAVDFTCPRSKAKRTFSTVIVKGFAGDPGSTTFDVTVYGDTTAAGPHEPDNATPVVVCATQRVTGSGTGTTYPVVGTVTIPISPCQAKRGTNWLEVQAVSEAGPWYWEQSSVVGGLYEADYRITAAGTPCTPGYVDGINMQTCLYGGDAGVPDFRFKLS